MPATYISSIGDLRKGLGDAANDYSDEELLSALSASTGMPLHEAAVKFKYDTNAGPWHEKLSSSVDAYQSSLYGVAKTAAGAVGASGLEAFANRRQAANKISSDIGAARAQEGGIPDSYHDVDGIGSAARYVGGLAVGSLPYMAEAAVGGVAGRAVRAGMGLEGLTTAERAATMTRAGIGGGVGASYPSSVGDILGNQEEQNGQTNGLAAAALGVPYAALNAFGESRLAATLHGPKSGVAALDRMTGFRGGLARTGMTGARLAAEEGISETGQEFTNQAGRMAVDSKAEFFSPDAIKRYKESFVGGAALGGVLGGGLGGWRRSGHGAVGDSSPMNPAVSDPGPTPTGPIDMMASEAQLQLGYDPTVGNGRYYAFPDGSVATGEEAAFARRMAPQATATTAYDAAVSSSPMAPATQVDPVSYAPIDALAVQTATGLRLLSTEPTNVQAKDWGNGIAFDEQAPAPTTAPMPGGRVGSLSTEGLATPGQAVVQRAGMQPADTTPQIQQPVPAQSQGDQQAPQVQPRAPATPDGIAASEANQTRIQSAHEAIGRAQDAGMTTDKQQTAFWRAEQLVKDGKLTESKLTQVIALLTQHMLPRANKILDEAAVGVGHEDLQAKFKGIDKAQAEIEAHLGEKQAAQLEIEQLQQQRKDILATPQDAEGGHKRTNEYAKLGRQIEKVKVKLAAANAKAHAVSDHVAQLKKVPHTESDSLATAAPIAVPDVASATPAATMQAPSAGSGTVLKTRAEQAGKLKRYQALLACLK